MADKTTATTDFNLDLNTIVEEAFERCGAELRSGYDLRTAKRSLSLLLMDWSNRGINLWTLEQGTHALTYNVGTYDLPADTVDLLDHVIRTGTGTNQIDINISRISSSTYVAIPNKNATGRPIQIWINRRTGATDANNVVVYPQFTVWPKPDNSTPYTIYYTRLRRMFDVGNGSNGQDIPFRFLPCMVAGLAYMLSMKIPGSEARMASLKAQYDEAWDLAAGEDREKAAVRFVPRQSFLGGY
jgi:hypothetical protein